MNFEEGIDEAGKDKYVKVDKLLMCLNRWVYSELIGNDIVSVVVVIDIYLVFKEIIFLS